MIRFLRQLTSGTREVGERIASFSETSGPLAPVRRAALRDHLVEPELDVALESGELSERRGPSGAI